MSLAGRRLARLARRRSLGWTVDAVCREAALLRDETRLRRSLRSGRRIVVGPFAGEVGYELLYWRPLVLRLLRSHDVDPERVVVVSRGGAGEWYRDVATHALDILELVGPDDLRSEIEARAARTGQRKQIDEDAFDAQILSLVRERIGDADVLHPRLMYNRLRFLWDGLRAPAEALRLGDYDDLPRVALQPAVEARLPTRFAAVKLYYNHSLPDSREVRDRLAELVSQVELPVVLLEAGTAVDDHGDWTAVSADSVRIADALEPASNLAAQAEIVARADLLLATYGGFSYTGAFHGTPTKAVSLVPEDNERHEQVLRAVRPTASYERLRLSNVPAGAA